MRTKLSNSGIFKEMNSEYQVGGSLNVNAASYVIRQADSQLYETLLQGEFCYVFNCRQMGKSSLRVRFKNRLESQGYACVSLDMTKQEILNWTGGQPFLTQKLCKLAVERLIAKKLLQLQEIILQLNLIFYGI